jgi:hypothetical protein
MDVLLAKLKVLHQPQLASLLIALLNSQNNRQALSRGEVKRSALPTDIFLVALFLINMDVLLIYFGCRTALDPIDLRWKISLE